MRQALAAVFAAGVLLTGCSDSTDTGSVSSSPTPRESEVTDPVKDVVVDIAIKDGKVTPQGERVDVLVGQPVILRITSDADEEIHVHSEPEKEFKVRAGDQVEEMLTIDTPGQVAVEAHEVDATIVQLVVRP
ncbi:hypothetical protein [Aeromicrobium sp.]|uniref:hypothetical protein n=1 Tax=Aeromicrobium sp. TaxID=1871063 RepID=UPI003D6B1FB0